MSTLNELVIEQLGLDSGIKITLESSFVEDLGADSLDLVQLMLALEEKFGIEIDDKTAETLITVGDVLDYLREKGFEVG